VDPARQFDFLEGEWDVVCRVPRDGGWDETPGRLTATRVLDGHASLEFFDGGYHGGLIKAVGLRAYNRSSGEWEHTWTDSLEPGHFHVWRGRFENGTIDLFAEWNEPDGRPVRSRLTWSAITQDSAHWESARSHDGGRTWTLHWIVEHRRRST
jgi:hypothetical protein